MQEEIEQKSVTLSIQAAKLTSKLLAKAIAAALRRMRDGPKQGKMTMRQLARRGDGLTNVEINDDNIKSFERYARKYGVDFALKKDGGTPPKWLVFFKAKDADALTAAFNEFTRDTLGREKKPSVRETIRNFKEVIRNAVLERQPKHRDRGERGGGPEL